jgi:Zn-dependent peptidase ImmA (M78 family)
MLPPELGVELSRLRRERDGMLLETIANSFAAELLAPRAMVTTFLRGLPSGEDRVRAMCEQFGMSARATRLRLSELGVEPTEESSFVLFG